MIYKKPSPKPTNSINPKPRTTSSSKSADKGGEKQAPRLDYNLINMSFDQVRDELTQLIREKSLFEKDSILPSGRITGNYLDLKEALLSARGAYLASMAILHNLKDEVEAIGGSMDKTYSLAVSVSQLAFLSGLEIDSFYVKEGEAVRTFGHSRWIEGPLRPGARICVVQDQIISGQRVIETIRRLQEEADAQIVQVIAIVDRQDGARIRLQEYGVDFTSIITMDDILDYSPAM